jgi:hypothetical protein
VPLQLSSALANFVGLTTLALLTALSPSAPRGDAATRAPALDVVAGPTAVSAVGTGTERSIELDEATLAPELRAELVGRSLGATAFGETTLDDAAIRLDDGRLVVRGTVVAGWIILPLDLTGTAVVSAGVVSVVVDEAYVGNTVLPGPARREVQRALQVCLERELSRPGLVVQSIAIEPGRLIATGRVRPQR